MADKKISQLTALSAANLAPSTDVLAIVDTSATETKKIVAQDLINGVLNVASAVGIGTASPAYKLDVAESGAPTSTNTFSVARISGSDSVANDLTLLGPNTSQVRIKFGDPEDATIGEVGYNHSTNSLRFVTNGAQVGVFDSSGNLGLGVTPSLWNSDYKALNIGSKGIVYGRVGSQETAIGANWYRTTAAAFVYASNGFATFYAQDSGNHTWHIAPNNTSGAGATASFTQAMTLNASSQLLVNQTASGGSAAKLQVGGANGSTNAGAIFAVEKVNEGYGLYVGVEGSGASFIQAGTANDSTYYNLHLQRNGGNLGIGTTSPAQKLDVAGGMKGGVIHRKGTYSAGATTPSVSGVSYLDINNSSPTSITNFTGAVEGQMLMLVFRNANTTITRNNAYLAGSVNFTSATNATLTLVYDGTSWYEVCRSTSNG